MIAVGPQFNEQRTSTATQIQDTRIRLDQADYLIVVETRAAMSAENAGRLGRPNAAYDVANTVWLAAQQFASRGGTPSGTGRLRVIDLLSRNQVHWDEDTSLPRVD